MMKNVLAAVFAAAAFLTSCTSQRSTATTAAFEPRLEQSPTVADLDVQPQAVAEIEWFNTPFTLDRISFRQRMENLEADLLLQQKADVLLEPRFTCTRRLFGRCAIQVTGYPARLSNFRKATPADLEVLRANVPAHRKRIYRVSDLWQKKVLPLLKLKKS